MTPAAGHDFPHDGPLGGRHLVPDPHGAGEVQTELEGELLIAFVSETLVRMAEVRGAEAPPVRVAYDVGSGPGVGTCELARRFPQAAVTAIDASPAMLERAEARAAASGFGSAVTTHLAELPGGLDGLEQADIIWTSMMLHHVGDEVGTLRLLHDLLEPDHGLLGVAERADPVQCIPEDVTLAPQGLPGRVDAALRQRSAALRAGLTGSEHGADVDVEAKVSAAGFNVIGSFISRKRFDQPLSELGRRVAAGNARRARDQLSSYLDPVDLRALDVLADPDEPRSLHHRLDASLVASRQIVVAKAVRRAR